MRTRISASRTRVANQIQCYADLMSAMLPLGSPEGGGPVGLIALRQVSVALLAAHAREPRLLFSD